MRPVEINLLFVPGAIVDFGDLAAPMDPIGKKILLILHAVPGVSVKGAFLCGQHALEGFSGDELLCIPGTSVRSIELDLLDDSGYMVGLSFPAAAMDLFYFFPFHPPAH